MKLKLLGLLVLMCCSLQAKRVDYKPVGLPNVGNTCFSNSLVQCLYNIVPLTKSLLNSEGSFHLEKEYSALVKDINEAQRKNLKALDKKALKAFAQSGCAVMRRKEVETAELYGQNPDPREGIFGQQQDAQILLKMLFDNNFGKKYFGYTRNVRTICPKIGYDSLRDSEDPRRPDNFLDVVLNIPQTNKVATLEECWRHTWHTKTPEDYTVLGKQGRDCDKIIFFVELSEYLVVNLLRFHDLDGIKKRIDDSVVVPETLSLEEFSQDKNGTVYELIGVVRQAGSLTGGHYTAFIKNQYEQNPQWYHCDDSVISGPKNFGLISGEINKNGYMFFYKKNGAQGQGVEVVGQKQDAEKARKLEELVDPKAIQKLADALSEIALMSKQVA